jgi:hypothetical protein
MSVPIDWITYRLVNPITTVSGYFLIPAFDYDGLNWLGRSDMPVQFNYTASKRFALIGLPEKPVDANYVPTIKFRIGTRVFRYKLWDDPGLELEAAPYQSQIISENFVIEIWSLDGLTEVSQEDPLAVVTSIQRVVSDFSVIPANYVECVGTEVSAASIAVALPATFPMDFGAGGAWLDNEQSPCGNQPLAGSTAAPDTTEVRAILDTQGKAILDTGSDAILES